MSVCKYEHGAIWWRGSGDRWIYRLPDEARKLRDLFANEPAPYAQDYARQLGEAIAEYDADRAEEIAA